ncbi:hypothetical protein V1478_006400 [Vespula squamosa]|uniref:Uncharacterized protein n=1 Tax=Vespula squamosa TaxID=30214 RepID=A0ABD2B7S5_VESSQ
MDDDDDDNDDNNDKDDNDDDDNDNDDDDDDVDVDERDDAEEECDETKMILARHSPDQRRTTLLFRWHRRQHLDSLVHHTQFVSDGSSVLK